jgi:hypothetical protein
MIQSWGHDVMERAYRGHAVTNLSIVSFVVYCLPFMLGSSWVLASNFSLISNSSDHFVFFILFG